MSKPLEFTGERFTPECVREIWYEHFHRYAFAAPLVRGKTVLDAACGEGYGSALLARSAEQVTGIDISAEAIDHARSRYRAENLAFQQGDCLDLPLPDNSFDCVVSFETLEHLEDHDRLLGGFNRVLKPGGFLLLSSPDKAVYTDQLGSRNEFHVRELYRDELEALLARHFPAVQLWGQRLMFQSAIWSLEERPGVTLQQEDGGAVETSASPRHAATYLLALCAMDEDRLPSVEAGLSLFDDAAESVYQHYHEEIRKHMAAGERLAQLEQKLAAVEAERDRPPAGKSAWRRLFGKS